MRPQEQFTGHEMKEHFGNVKHIEYEMQVNADETGEKVEPDRKVRREDVLRQRGYEPEEIGTKERVRAPEQEQRSGGELSKLTVGEQPAPQQLGGDLGPAVTYVGGSDGAK